MCPERDRAGVQRVHSADPVQAAPVAADAEALSQQQPPQLAVNYVALWIIANIQFLVRKHPGELGLSETT
jgi:hypothetical protein